LWPRAPRFAFVPSAVRKNVGKSVNQEEVTGVSSHVPLQTADDRLWTSNEFEKPDPALELALLSEEVF
jgi:hypothetical protein